MALKPLTAKQQRFVDSYDGDIKKAAGKSGINYNYARQLMTLPKHSHIVKAIKKRETTKSNKRIATREERQRFWTESMRDEELDAKDRFKASELLGRSEADFTDNIKGDLNITVLRKSYGT